VSAYSSLLIIILPFLIVYSAAGIYRSIYPKEQVLEALGFIAEYRALKSELRVRKTKRLAKKLAAMESEYKKNRSIVLKATLTKMILLVTGYLAGSILVLVVSPFLPPVYDLPPITVVVEGHLVIAGFMLFFLMYIVYYAMLRENFI